MAKYFSIILIQATDVVAEVENAILGKTTIRHKNCELLQVTTTRCSKCQGHRKSLHTILGRLKVSSNAAEISSHTNYRYLTAKARNNRMHNLHRSYVLERKKVTRMKKKVKNLMEKDGVQVSKGTNDDLKEILKENFSQISEKYPSNTFHRIFWNQHSQAASAKDVRGVRWHPAVIRWCLYLRHISGKAYETLRNTGVLRLPSQRTLRDYTHYVSAGMGFSAEVDKMLMDTLKVKLNSFFPNTIQLSFA